MMPIKSAEELQKALEESQAETAACLAFLEHELGWEYFRAEMLYSDDEAKLNCSEENARKLKNYLAKKGHGIALLRELHELRKASGGKP
jgi:hypothetical protein